MTDIHTEINSKASELIEVSGSAGVSFGFAESLTGGMISSSVVNIPGASSVFKGSVVSYTNEVKENVLGVPSEVIDTYTEVSEECAAAMARGALSVLGVDLAISVTGIAGPSGDMPGKPIGTVYMGYCYEGPDFFGLKTGVLRLNFEGDRDTIRTCTVLEALNCAVRLIKEGRA